MIMSARQFAEKYHGQIVKITTETAHACGARAGIPLGTVVGFRSGTKGIVGSSKVAIWRDKYDLQDNLEFKSKSFESVVSSPPDYRKGVYFLSVSSIELVNPPKQDKPIIAYPDHCGRCGASSRSSKRFTVCSNEHCKENRFTIKALGTFPKPKIVDQNGYILCPTCQKNDLDFTEQYGNQRDLICRANKRHTWKHDWKEGQKIHYRGRENYIWQSGVLKVFRS